MERFSDIAIEIINNLHTERLDYETEYLPLIDAANTLANYEDTNHTPEDCAAAFAELDALKRNPPVQVESNVLELAMECSKLKQELAAYRAAEQDGTLHWLPCPVGTMVWSYDLCNCLYQGERCPYDCNSSQRKTVFNKNCLKYCEVYQFEFTINHLNFFGKTVFLTKEEAEAALKEQEGNDGK